MGLFELFDGGVEVLGVRNLEPVAVKGVANQFAVVRVVFGQQDAQLFSRFGLRVSVAARFFDQGHRGSSVVVNGGVPTPVKSEQLWVYSNPEGQGAEA